MDRSRDIDVLVSAGSRLFKPEVGAQTHTKYIYLEFNSRADYTNIFCFQIGAKLRKLGKNANFANFAPPF